MGSILSKVLKTTKNGLTALFVGYFLYRFLRYSRSKYRVYKISNSSFQPLILIIGAGFSGLLVGIHLKTRLNYNNFIICDKLDSIGGTWAVNDYPGCECDVVGSLYSYSFEPKSDWSETYPPQIETLQYLKDCVRKYKLESHIRLNTEVKQMRYDTDNQLWNVRILNTHNQKSKAITPSIVISGVGLLSNHKIPPFKGLHNAFKGQWFHSSQWNHSYDFANKNVAVIGTGSSAVQIIPEIAKRAIKNLYVFSRSCSHCFYKQNKPISSLLRLCSKIPMFTTLHRWYNFVYFELTVYPPLKRTENGKKARQFLLNYWQRHRDRVITDRELREKTTPKCIVQTKRPLLSQTYYKTFNQENVHLIQQKNIECFTAKDIIYTESDGNNGLCQKRIENIDCVVFATGFRTQEFLCSIEGGIYGLNKDLCLQSDVWKKDGFDNAFAHYGTTVHGFPNFFMMYGPGTNAYVSLVYMLECQSEYITNMIEQMIVRNIRQINVKKEVMNEFNARLEMAGKETVWSTLDTGDNNWYINKEGKITTNWPWSTTYFWWLTRNANINDDFELEMETVKQQMSKL